MMSESSYSIFTWFTTNNILVGFFWSQSLIICSWNKYKSITWVPILMMFSISKTKWAESQSTFLTLGMTLLCFWQAWRRCTLWAWSKFNRCLTRDWMGTHRSSRRLVNLIATFHLRYVNIDTFKWQSWQIFDRHCFVAMVFLWGGK